MYMFMHTIIFLTSFTQLFLELHVIIAAYSSKITTYNRCDERYQYFLKATVALHKGVLNFPMCSSRDNTSIPLGHPVRRKTLGSVGNAQVK